MVKCISTCFFGALYAVLDYEHSMSSIIGFAAAVSSIIGFAAAVLSQILIVLFFKGLSLLPLSVIHIPFGEKSDSSNLVCTSS